MRRSQAISILWIAASLSACKVTPPGKWETTAITKVKHSVTVGGKNDKNPLANTLENAQNGSEAFSHYCVACHGLDGQNTGVPFADQMSPPIPPLNSPNVQSYTDGQLHWILVNGIAPSGMPASKGILTEDELWSIVLFIRHLPPAGSLGEPPFYSGDDPATSAPSSTRKR